MNMPILKHRFRIYVLLRLRVRTFIERYICIWVVRFILVENTEMWKWLQNIPIGHKIQQMALLEVPSGKIFHSKAVKNKL
jgi:hypothetical protein